MAGVFQLNRIVFVVERLRPRDFFQVVVLRREPEYWDASETLLGQVLGKADSGQSFVEGKGGAGDEPHLLAGDHGEGVGGGQAANIPKRFLRTSERAVLSFEHAHKRAAVSSFSAKRSRCGHVCRGLERAVGVETAYALEIVQEVEEQRARPRHACVGNRFHQASILHVRAGRLNLTRPPAWVIRNWRGVVFGHLLLRSPSLGFRP